MLRGVIADAFRGRRAATFALAPVDPAAMAPDPGSDVVTEGVIGQPNLRDSLPVVYHRARSAISLARGTLALTCAASVLLDRRYRRSPRANLGAGLMVAQWVHDDLALRSGREAALRRVRWLSPAVAAVAQLSLPQTASSSDGGAANWFYLNGVWVGPSVALAGGRRSALVASATQLPLIWRAVRDANYRTYAVGNQLSIGLLAVVGRLFGESGAQAHAMFERVAAERRDAAESEAAVASMRAALGPAVEHLVALEATLLSEPRSAVLEECRRLERWSRSLQFRNERRATGLEWRWDDREARSELATRMRRVAAVAYLSSLMWCALANAEAVRRGLVSRERAVITSSLLFGLAAWGIIDRGPLLTGVATPVSRSRTLWIGLVGGVMSAELHRGAVSPGFDTSVRNQVQLQAAAMAASPWELGLGQLISTAVGGWFEWSNISNENRPAYAAQIIGYSWGLPQAIHLFLSGLWEAQRQSDEARRSQAELASQRGLAQGAEWAARASHDYVAQSLLYLQRHPDLDADSVLAVLSDARTNLEQALDPAKPASHQGVTEGLAECLQGYRVFGLEAAMSVRFSEGDARPASPSGPDEAVTQALLLALNQGLSNVLAHSEDRCPTVELILASGSARLSVTNRTADAAGQPDRGRSSGRGGYGLGAVEAAVTELDGRCEFSVGPTEAVLTVDLPTGPLPTGPLPAGEPKL